MSKTIAVINAGNIYAQSFLKSITGYNRIILGDCVNSRKSLLRTINQLRTNDPSVKIEHMNINSNLLLEQAIRNATTVVHFTHDYFSFVVEKNEQLQKTAQICKAYDVDKLVSVNPLEFVNYYNSNGFTDDPLNEETKAQDSALNTFSRTTILRTNLMFGSHSYLCRYLAQTWMENYSQFDNHFKNFRFYPLYYNDLINMVDLLVADESKAFHGKKFIANGNESLSFGDIDNLIKQTYSSSKQHTDANKLLKAIFYNWQLFFHGNTHVTNMNFMLQFLHNRNPQFSGHENAAQALGMKLKSFREYYSQKAEKFDDRLDSEIDLLKYEEPSDLRFPRLQNYWNISLD